MAETKNVETVKSLYENFAAGDLQAVLAGFAEDAEIEAAGPRGAVPWAGRYKGRAEAEKFFAHMGQAVDYQAFEPLEYIAQGDRVVTVGRETWRAKGTGATCEQAWVTVLTLRDGKIARMRVFEDTAAVAAAIGGKQ